MAILNLPVEDHDLLRRGLDHGIRVLEQTGRDTYRTTSSRPGVEHTVWAQGRKTNCDCKRSALARKRCTHGAIVLAFIAWRHARAVEEATHAGAN